MARAKTVSPKQERRKFERLSLPKSAKAIVALPDEKKLGSLSMLGRGGFQVQTTKAFYIGDVHQLILIDKSEGIHRKVRSIVRNLSPGGLIGFEFENLEPDAAVEIGVIIGKYYSASATSE